MGRLEAPVRASIHTYHGCLRGLFVTALSCRGCGALGVEEGASEPDRESQRLMLAKDCRSRSSNRLFLPPFSCLRWQREFIYLLGASTE